MKQSMKAVCSSSFLAYIHFAESLTIHAPVATDFAVQQFGDAVRGWTPIPTSAPFTTSTTNEDLRRRAQEVIYGYINGDRDFPLSCGSGSSFFTRREGYYTCCSTDDSGSAVAACAPSTYCLDYSSDRLYTNANTLYCVETMPYCTTASLEASFGTLEGVGCASEAGDYLVYPSVAETPFSGSYPARPFTVGLPTNVADSTASGAGTLASTGSASGSDDFYTVSRPNAGALAGAIVGGVVAVALVAGGCFIYWLRLKKQGYLTGSRRPMQNRNQTTTLQQNTTDNGTHSINEYYNGPKELPEQCTLPRTNNELP